MTIYILIPAILYLAITDGKLPTSIKEFRHYSITLTFIVLAIGAVLTIVDVATGYGGVPELHEIFTKPDRGESFLDGFRRGFQQFNN